LIAAAKVDSPEDDELMESVCSCIQDGNGTSLKVQRHRRLQASPVDCEPTRNGDADLVFMTKIKLSDAFSAASRQNTGEELEISRLCDELKRAVINLADDTKKELKRKLQDIVDEVKAKQLSFADTRGVKSKRARRQRNAQPAEMRVTADAITLEQEQPAANAVSGDDLEALNVATTSIDGNGGEGPVEGMPTTEEDAPVNGGGDVVNGIPVRRSTRTRIPNRKNSNLRDSHDNKMKPLFDRRSSKSRRTKKAEQHLKNFKPATARGLKPNTTARYHP